MLCKIDRAGHAGTFWFRDDRQRVRASAALLRCHWGVDRTLVVYLYIYSPQTAADYLLYSPLFPQPSHLTPDSLHAPFHSPLLFYPLPPLFPFLFPLLFSSPSSFPACPPDRGRGKFAKSHDRIRCGTLSHTVLLLVCQTSSTPFSLSAK